MRRYEDRVVAITGAGQGLGLAMVERFAAEGATVIMADVNPDGMAAAAARLGAAVTTHQVDVADAEEARSWIEETVREHGRLDVLVNNAGIIRDNRVEDISDADWYAVIDVNLGGTFNCSRAAFATMKQQRHGRILSFSSMSWRGNFGQANYVAAKAGIVGLTRTLALEGARHGITANAIAPGLIETPMLASMNAPARQKLVSKVPAGHTGTPEDIAEAAAFLASDAAGYITGVVLDVDGGISIGSSIR